MTANGLIVAQRPSCSPATQAKAKGLLVHLVTRRLALVQGATNTYAVTMDDLRCECKAGMAGLHCSHVLRAITARAELLGRDDVTFYNDASEMEADHVDIGGICHSEHGYYWNERQTPPPQKAHAEYSAASGDLVVTQGGKVVGHASTYLQAEGM